MTLPVFESAPVLTAVPVGLAFGVALERAGLGSARTIADQLKGRDFTVIKVMFSAIVTAMLGVFWAERLGWLDLSRLAIPLTDIVPQLIGSVLFGAGFALASLCPGTACVSAATGAGDGFAAIAGLFAGTLITSALWPTLGAVAELAPREGARLPVDLGLSTGLVVAVIAAMGGLVIRYADRLSPRRAAEPEAGRLLRPPGGLAVTVKGSLAAAALALGAMAAFSGDPPAPAASVEEITTNLAEEARQVDALELAGWIRTGRPSVRVVELRDSAALNPSRIPVARQLSLAEIVQLEVAPADTVVLYSDVAKLAEQAWVVLRARGVTNLFILRDAAAAVRAAFARPRGRSTCW